METSSWLLIVPGVARFTLDFLRIATAWPVAVALIAWLFFKKFQEPISWLIRNGRWKAAWGPVSGTFEPVQQETPTAEAVPPNSDEQSGRGTTKERPTTIRADTIDSAANIPRRDDEVVDPQNLSRIVEDLKNERDNANRLALHNYFLWLEAFLVPKTKAALAWVASKGLVQKDEFNAVVRNRVATDDEARNTVQALESTGLLRTTNDFVSLGPNADRYLHWRQQSNLVPIPPFESFPHVSVNPVVPAGSPIVWP